MYKELRNQIVTLCRLSKKLHYQKFFTEKANNIKNTWKGIKSIINIWSNTKNVPTSLLVNNRVNSDPTKIANTFNNYFSSIAGNLQGEIYHNGQDFNNYLKYSNEYNFFMNPTDKYEIVDIINNLNVNTSTGPHSIPNYILQLIRVNIAEPLSEIV